MTGLLLFTTDDHPHVGQTYGSHVGCGGRLVWSYVPPREAAPMGPGVATCRRCEAFDYAWPEQVQALAARDVGVTLTEEAEAEAAVQWWGVDPDEDDA